MAVWKSISTLLSLYKKNIFSIVRNILKEETYCGFCKFSLQMIYLVVKFSYWRWDGMKEKLIRFMQGRYGADQLSRFTVVFSLILILVSNFIRIDILRTVVDGFGLLLLVLSYYRMFSKDISARYEENRKFMLRTSKIRSWFYHQKKMMTQRKIYHIYKCPTCKQKIRIPKGKGKIEISCPKCSTKFIKRS